MYITTSFTSVLFWPDIHSCVCVCASNKITPLTCYSLFICSNNH